MPGVMFFEKSLKKIKPQKSGYPYAKSPKKDRVCEKEDKFTCF